MSELSPIGLSEGFVALVNRANSLPIADIDYIGEDGYLHCGLCHSRKECDVKGIRVRCLCDCANKGKAEAEEKKKREQWQTRRSEWMSGYESMTFENDAAMTKCSKLAHAICDKWDEVEANGYGFALYGSVGCGKTFSAACVANWVIDQGKRAWMSTMSRIIDQWFTKGDEIENRLKNFELVVIDDFGAQRDTDYAAQRVFDAFDMRMNSGKATIITSNLDLSKPPEDITTARIVSRILGHCTAYRMTGEDLRVKSGAERKKEMEANLFGTFR